MLKTLVTLTKLELINIFNINVIRHTKDKTTKKKALTVSIIVAFLLLYIMIYLGFSSYSLSRLGLGYMVPTFSIIISSAIIFFIDIFKSGSTIYKTNCYDIMCSFPLSHTIIIISRILHMYVEGLLVSLLVFLPSFIVYGFYETPNLLFYFLGILEILFAPLLPIALSILIGVVITGISSRLKYKSIFSSLMLVGVFAVIILCTSTFSTIEDELSTDAIKTFIIDSYDSMTKHLPSIGGLGDSISDGIITKWLMYNAINLAIFALVSFIVIITFKSIQKNLSTTSAKHDYKFSHLKQKNVLSSLCIKEFRKYLSSSVYITNTIVGPIMSVIFSASLFFIDIDKLTENIPITINTYIMLPLLLGGIMCLMSPASVSISMEGKQWWISQTLPLSTKIIIDSKILMTLLLFLPFYIVSELLIIIATKPDILTILWQLISTALILIFSSVYCIFINLHFPNFNWDNEASVVKQSISSMLGGIGSFLIAFVLSLIVGITPKTYSYIVNPIICLVLLIITILSYDYCIKRSLTTLAHK